MPEEEGNRVAIVSRSSIFSGIVIVIHVAVMLRRRGLRRGEGWTI